MFEARIAQLELEVAVIKARLGHNDIMSSLHVISDKITLLERKMQEDADRILAKVSANNDRIESQTQMLRALAEGQADIKAEIEALKTQGAAIDLGPLEAATDKQTTLIEGAGAAINSNTSG